MPKIPESDITQIKKTIDLVSLCHSRNIPLKKTGKNYLGKCPFHDDDKASFTVNPAENLFHCFGDLNDNYRVCPLQLLVNTLVFTSERMKRRNYEKISLSNPINQVKMTQ